ncbi:PREDICTED: sodium-dependent proline transporter-like [Priapulus caudatus]|uniref:Transporter n=1 Tax=Priapulus caudatus TaxID=37621 RepID=A0ABM1EDL9_PRICU|nr:PREDICTED: sodium-dependent proline transporter-like [Priapulus caudatus]XP_014670290.1 PREDICTED: sodium-dependent proline transporter-like [Priapulus caudatus]
MESNTDHLDSKSSSGEGEENKSRDHWTGKLDFLLSCVGYAIGLGNAWRFPYICYTNGGGAFLVPYLIALFVCGMPLFFMEVAMGQFSSRGAIAVWNICPLFKGLGVATVVITCLQSFYYHLLIAYILFYLVMSFTKQLPWETCGNPWNTAACVRRGVDVLIGTNMSAELQNHTEFADTVMAALANSSAVNVSDVVIAKATTPSEEFWYNFILEITDGLHVVGGIHWKLLLAHFIGYVFVFICIHRGVKSIGKVVYFTATCPYVLLGILLVRSATLPGAVNGLKYYLTPQWELLLDFKVWGLAFVQIFYSLGPGFGTLITMASYNRFHDNMLREAYLVPIINSATSIFAGLVVFTALGYMAEITNLEVKDVVATGPGLAFIVYPEVITHLAVSPLWAIVFFCMLLTLGLDSQFVMIETIVTVVWDHFSSKLKKGKILITLAVCVFMFLLGVPLTTRAGSYLFVIVDWYAIGYSVMLICLAEVLVVGWLYGASRLLDDVEFMVGRRVLGRTAFIILWKFIVPVVLLVILFFSMITHVPVTYFGYEYPMWSIAFGWVLAMMSIIPIPVYAIYHLTHVQCNGTFWQRLRGSIRPSDVWGPALEPYRSEYWYARLTHGNGAPPEGKQAKEQEMRLLKKHDDEDHRRNEETQQAAVPPVQVLP